jgi:SAM-dependent methyltransferase
MSTTPSSPAVAPVGLKYRIAANPLLKKIWKYWYPLVTRRLGSDDVVFLNYAYEEDPPMALPLAAGDEPYRLNIQLYHRVATQESLTGKNVLEVSCGHGGGASYLVRTVHPASYTGLDLNPDGIAFCKDKHHLPGLDFVEGDAENLEFPDNFFDAVVNVEASHCYPHFPRFLEEVTRVLRPGGHLLYADFRLGDNRAVWEAAMASAPMRLLSSTDISAEVQRGMDNNAERSEALIRSRMPLLLRGFARNFAGVPGSRFYREMAEGHTTYRMCNFVKDA